MSGKKNYRTYVLPENEYDRWDKFILENAPRGTVFQTSFYLETVSRIQALDLKVHVVEDNNGDIAGGFAGCSTRKFGIWPILVVPQFTPVYAPSTVNRNTKYVSKQESFHFEIVSVLLEHLWNHYRLLDFRFPYSHVDIRPYSFSDFMTGVHYTYLIDLTDPDTIFERFDSDVKRRIRKAQEEAYDLRSDHSAEHTKILCALISSTYRKQGLSLPYSEQDLHRLFRMLHDHNKLAIYSISVKEGYVGGMVVVCHGNLAYYWIAGSDDRYLYTGLNQLLMYEALKDLHDRGVEKIELVGANTPSVARYKSTYGGKIQPYYSVESAKGLPAFLLRLKSILKGE